MKRSVLIFAVLLATFAIAARLAPHLPNVAPIGAFALFCGWQVKGRFGFLLPLAALFLSDAIIGFYDPWLMLAVYGSFLATYLLGRLLARTAVWPNVVLGSLAGSIFFFLATNAAVWAFSHWYPPTPAGLMSAYLMGLPFFKATLLGDLAYSGVFFGAFSWLKFYLKTARKEQQTPPGQRPGGEISVGLTATSAVALAAVNRPVLRGLERQFRNRRAAGRAL